MLRTDIPGTRLNNSHSYGPNGAILLYPTAGEALHAAQVFQRDSILIHGGAPGPDGTLRPTGGCLRLSNSDMKQLSDIVMLIQMLGDPINACSINHGIEVSVRGVATDPGEDYDRVSDPPDVTGVPEMANPYEPPHTPPPGYAIHKTPVRRGLALHPGAPSSGPSSSGSGPSGGPGTSGIGPPPVTPHNQEREPTYVTPITPPRSHTQTVTPQQPPSGVHGMPGHLP